MTALFWLQEHHAGHYDYSFGGEDWKQGKDDKGQPWTCGTGSLQSPINLLALEAATQVSDM